jgi:putative phosphoesterase
MANRKIVGVISDTHGVLNPRVPSLFKGVDYILHAGDIGNLQVYYQLQKLAPVTAISGNIDEGNLPLDFESQRTIELYGVRIFMIHILGNPLRLKPATGDQIARLQPDVVVFGHSHQPFMQQLGSVLFFNPGSAGPKRFSLPRCLGFLEIEKRQVHARLVEL